jgi:methylenetetrahydrofolate reductase (NADPH)
MPARFDPTDRHVAQFEVLPLERTQQEAARLPHPLLMTVTCSPLHGPDESIAVAARLTELGHCVAVHLAARMVRERAHLNRMLAAMARCGVVDVFLIGGDATPPHGPYPSAVDLLPVLAEHPQRPRTIGIAGYPEGHPDIDDDTLAEALERKSAHADYIMTQLCFDPDGLLSWVDDTRRRGVTLPILVGAPGVVDRKRLLKMAMKIGVGSSLAFLRKQRGLRNLLWPVASPADRIYDAVAPCLDDPHRNLMGFHFYTFNQLVDTWQWECDKRGEEATEPRFGRASEEALRR